MLPTCKSGYILSSSGSSKNLLSHDIKAFPGDLASSHLCLPLLPLAPRSFSSRHNGLLALAGSCKTSLCLWTERLSLRLMCYSLEIFKPAPSGHTNTIDSSLVNLSKKSSLLHTLMCFALHHNLYYLMLCYILIQFIVLSLDCKL